MSDSIRNDGQTSENPKQPDDWVSEHLRQIEAQVEEAKDPAAYETYDYKVSEADERICLFTARRKGKSHIRSKTPCQDYCLSAAVAGCTVLADADGVGSCEHSDVGSKLACEAVIRAVTAATKSCESEEQLVKRLLTVSFRERIVSNWLREVLRLVDQGVNLSAADRQKEMEKYASTLMYAVLTENWIVAGNLGDGQILMFNDSFGVKLRVHAPKYSSRVRCLVNAGCVREDFQTAKYPRSVFSGVLLSTDGMYDSLENGSHFYNYARQMKQRFLAQEPLKPYLPFCYEEPHEPFKDFSRMRTQDDCSIAVAIDVSENYTCAAACEEYETIFQSVLRHVDDAFLQRWSPDNMLFFIKRGNSFAEVVASRLADSHLSGNKEIGDISGDPVQQGEKQLEAKPNEVAAQEEQHPEAVTQETAVQEERQPETVPDKAAVQEECQQETAPDEISSKENGYCLKTAMIEEPCATWSEDGFFFEAYSNYTLPTIELMYSTGQLRRHGSSPEESEHLTLQVYRKIRRLKEELEDQKLTLNASAAFLVSFDGKNLCLRSGCLRKCLPDQDDSGTDGLEKYFTSLLGVLETETGEQKPLFDPGFFEYGVPQYREKGASDELAQIMRTQKELKLKNISACPWQLEDDVLLQTGEAIELKKTFTFALLDKQAEKTEIYTYRAKELL